MDDHSIVNLYLRRDETAIDRTAEKYGKRLYSLARGIVCDSGAAEECENDTYLSAWQSIPPHEPRDYLYAFLARITRHLALNCCRNRSRLRRSAIVCTLSEELEQCIPAPDDCACRLEDMALAEALNRFLATLSEQSRGIFLRRYWFADPITGIARRYGVSENSVKVSLSRSRAKLRVFLEKEGYIL